MRGHDFLVDFSGFRAKPAGSDHQLGNDIDERVDSPFRLQELIEYDHFSLLQYTITALEGTPFIAYDVFCLVEYFFYLIERCLRVFHHERMVQGEGTTYRNHGRSRYSQFIHISYRLGVPTGHPDHGNDHFFQAYSAMLKGIAIIIRVIIIIVGVAKKAITLSEYK
jgi:hypothetical protein